MHYSHAIILHIHPFVSCLFTHSDFQPGNYIDSRVLYDDELGPAVNRSNSMSLLASAHSLSSNALPQKPGSALPPAAKSRSLTHAQIQAVQAAQLAQQISLLNTQSALAQAHAKVGQCSVSFVEWQGFLVV